MQVLPLTIKRTSVKNTLLTASMESATYLT